MKTFELKKQQFVPRPLAEVFSFFSKPENLQFLTPKNLGFHILTPSPIIMKEGAIVDYVITIAGLPVRWTTVITCYEPPHRFVDLQLKGPYAYWHHTHTFSETDDGTIISDEVQYSMHLGLPGRCVHAIFVKRQLESIFELRACTIERMFSKNEETGIHQSISTKKVETV